MSRSTRAMNPPFSQMPRTSSERLRVSAVHGERVTIFSPFFGHGHFLAMGKIPMGGPQTCGVPADPRALPNEPGPRTSASACLCVRFLRFCAQLGEQVVPEIGRRHPAKTVSPMGGTMVWGARHRFVMKPGLLRYPQECVQRGSRMCLDAAPLQFERPVSRTSTTCHGKSGLAMASHGGRPWQDTPILVGVPRHVPLDPSHEPAFFPDAQDQF